MENDLSSIYLSELRRLVEPSVPVALLDFPDHGNVGDSAIWAGEVRMLEKLGCRVAYSSDIFAYSEESLRKCMPFGQVLLHGGGNFGTVWPENQFWREAVMARLTEYKIIQLPQTIQFADDAGVERAAMRIASHPDFTLMVRDERSKKFAIERLRANTVLCPDAAFMLMGELKRRSPVVDALVLARSDHEAGANALATLGAQSFSLEVTDWLDEAQTGKRKKARLLKKLSRTSLGGVGRWQRMQWAALSELADEHIERGVEILSRGKVVITDRLHAHILSTLLGIPNVVLDNNYGKIHGFIKCWHPAHPLVHMVHSREEAVAKAQALLTSL